MIEILDIEMIYIYLRKHWLCTRNEFIIWV